VVQQGEEEAAEEVEGEPRLEVEVVEAPDVDGSDVANLIVYVRRTRTYEMTPTPDDDHYYPLIS